MIKSKKRLKICILIVAVFVINLLENNISNALERENGLNKPIYVRVFRHTKTGIKVCWNSTTEVDGYVIYRYDKIKKKYTKVHLVDNPQEKEWIDKGLQTNRIYKYKMSAYKIENGKKKYSQLSEKVWAKTYKKKAKKINARAPKVSVKNVYLGLCSTKEIKSRVVASPYGKNKHKKPISTKVRWSSSNVNIATVNDVGVITAGTKLGICYVYAQSHNGVRTKIKVTVKNYAKTNDYYNYGTEDDIYTLITDYRTEIQNIAEYYSIHRVKKGSPIEFSLSQNAELVVTPNEIDITEIENEIKTVLTDFPYYVDIRVTCNSVEFKLRKEDTLESLPAYVNFWFDRTYDELWNIQIASHWTAYRFRPV